MDQSLLCAESPCADGPLAVRDSTLLNDCRVLDNLLALQLTTKPAQNYFTHIQTDILPQMRQIVTSWMLEVCEAQECEEQVFGVAVNLLDRFLCTTIVQRTQLQLLGAVCLLLASKWRQSRSISVELLSYYTDGSISHEEIKKWELVVLSKLGWDLSTVTAGDFLEHLFRKLPFAAKHNVARDHAVTFVALATTEATFLQVEPSSLAVAAIGAAIRGLRFPNWRTSLASLAAVVECDISIVERLMAHIEDIVERAKEILPDAHSHPTPAQSSSSGGPNSTKHQINQQSNDFFEGSETPTDISDIMF